MPFRQQQRITDTQDLTATLRSAGGSGAVHRVLNLSEGGMLIAGSDPGLDNGELTSFELAARDFSAAGVAHIVHHTGQASGLRFLRWQGHGGSHVQALVAAGSSSPAHGIPGKYLG